MKKNIGRKGYYTCRKLLREGYTIEQIAIKLGLPKATVARYVKPSSRIRKESQAMATEKQRIMLEILTDKGTEPRRFFGQCPHRGYGKSYAQNGEV